MIIDIQERPNAQTDLVVRVGCHTPRPFAVVAAWLRVTVPQVYAPASMHGRPEVTGIRVHTTGAYDVTVRLDSSLPDALHHLAEAAQRANPDTTMNDRLRAVANDPDLFISEAASGSISSWTGIRSSR